MVIFQSITERVKIIPFSELLKFLPLCSSQCYLFNSFMRQKNFPKPLLCRKLRELVNLCLAGGQQRCHQPASLLCQQPAVGAADFFSQAMRSQ